MKFVKKCSATVLAVSMVLTCAAASACVHTHDFKWRYTSTVTLQVACLLPAFAVISTGVVVTAFAVTLPVASTSTLVLSAEVQVTVAPAGSVVAVKVSLPPTFKVSSDLFNLTLLTAGSPPPQATRPIQLIAVSMPTAKAANDFKSLLFFIYILLQRRLGQKHSLAN